jgi:hypothetical protein
MASIVPFGLFAAAFYLTALGYVYQARGMTISALVVGAAVVVLMVAFFRAALRKAG